MTKRILMFAFAAVLTLAPVGQAFAQGQSKDETAINDKNAATGQALAMLVPQQCFSSGSGLTLAVSSIGQRIPSTLPRPAAR